MADDSNRERAERILDAALELFVHYGYGKTTVSDIAREAGVSKGAIYLHWSSKEDLLEALIWRESERVLDDTLRRIEADHEHETLFGLYQHSILALMANPLMLALLTRDQRVLGDWARRFNKTGAQADSYWFRQELVREMQAAGVMRADFSAEVLAHLLTAIRVGFALVGEFVPAEGTPPLEEVGRALAAMLDRGLSPEGGGDRQAGRDLLIRMMEMMRTKMEQWRQGVRK